MSLPFDFYLDLSFWLLFSILSKPPNFATENKQTEVHARLGVGYITPVSTLVKYFPNHRGFATGLAIMGFGFAALIAGKTPAANPTTIATVTDTTTGQIEQGTL